MTFSDADFREKTQLALNWAAHFRVPREWWESDAVRQNIARAARERIQREMPRIIERARALRANSQTRESDELLTQTIAYVQRMQTLVPRMMNGDTTGAMLRNVTEGFNGLVHSMENYVVSAAEGAVNLIGDVFSPLPIVVAVFAIMFLMRGKA